MLDEDEEGGAILKFTGAVVTDDVGVSTLSAVLGAAIAEGGSVVVVTVAVSAGKKSPPLLVAEIAAAVSLGKDGVMVSSAFKAAATGGAASGTGAAVGIKGGGGTDAAEVAVAASDLAIATCWLNLCATLFKFI